MTNKVSYLGLIVTSWVVILTTLACSGMSGQDTGMKPDERLMVTSAVDLGTLKDKLVRAEALESTLVKGSVDLGAGTIKYYSETPGQDIAGSVPLEKENLSIVDHGPDGELPIEVRKPTIYVMFNLPMVPLAKLGEPMKDSPIFKIEPSIPGTYRWYGTRVLSFEPDAPIVDKPFYTATVSADAQSLGGRKLGKEFNFTIISETVTLVNFYPGNNPSVALGTYDVPTKEARYIVLEFNQPVEPSHMKQFLKVEMAGKAVGFAVGRPNYTGDLAMRSPRGLLLTLDRDPPENTSIAVKIADGASPQPGYPSHKGEQTANLATVTPFVIRNIRGYSYDMPRNNKPGTIPVYVGFSHTLDQTAPQQRYDVTVNGKKATPAAIEAFGATLRLGMDGLNPGDRITMQASEATKDIYGRPLSNPKTIVEMMVPEPNPYAAFPARGFSQLEAGFPPKVIWEARNLDGVQFSATKGEYSFNVDPYRNLPDVPLTDVNISSWQRNKVMYNIVDLKSYLNAQGFGTVLLNWATRFNEQNNYVSRNQGHFAVQVTDIGVTTRFAYNRVLVWANSLKTGTPVAGAKVVLVGRNGPTDKTGTTDFSGLASIELSAGEFPSLFGTQYCDYRLRIRVQKGPDVSEFPVYNTQNSWTETTLSHGSPATIEQPRNRIMIFSDRGLYKPGEELALRGIHRRQDPVGFAAYRGGYSEVQVNYETLDRKAVGEKDLKLGETYRVKATVSTPKRRARLELLVPIPSGLEIVDPTFSTTGTHANMGGTGGESIRTETVYGDQMTVTAEGSGRWSDSDWYWFRYYPDSFALDNMMVYRWTDFYAGSRTLDFLVRVTSPGIYPTPSAQASLELEPEVFGR